MDLQVTGDGGTVAVSDAVFGADFNEALVHQVVTAYLAGARAGTRGHKNRSAVSGGGAKPWRQKGTGRARAGTIRSPLWRGGGKTFAATPQDWTQKVNRKQYRAAMRSIVAELTRQGRLVVVTQVAIDEAKTKKAVGWLASVGADNAMIVSSEVTETMELALRNIPHVAITDVAGVDPVSLVAFEKIIVTVEALQALEGRLS